LPLSKHVQMDTKPEGPDAGDHLDVKRESAPEEADKLLAFDSPALWAIIAIGLIGAFNLMGPSHTGGFALAAAVGMVIITLLISAFALPQVHWSELPHRIGHIHHNMGELWIGFVSIVLALSGVEAIANLTGVMKKPIALTARKAIWVVAIEVAVFNLLLTVCMLNIYPLNRDDHQSDMLAFLAGNYVGMWGEWGVRILGGLLLLSAANTAITDMISIQYLMARDGELPQPLVRLNRFGVPWMPAIIASSIPIIVLLVSHDLDALAALYAIGVIGAVAINISLCSIHPRLRKMYRKIPMAVLGLFLLAIWVTLAFTKLHALIFVCIVLIIGLTARQVNKWLAARKERPSLLRQAIMEQLTPEVMGGPKILLGTYGSPTLAKPALAEAKRSGHALAVCFIRQVNLSYKFDSQRQTIDTDPAALRTFSHFLELGHDAGVPIICIYDSGPDAAELMAENAAVYGCDKVIIGTSRQGALYHLIRGHFQQRLEAILPPEIPVAVMSAEEAESEPPEPPAPPPQPRSPGPAIPSATH
ncbi:MAG TPA: universal stress protein, partial [Tepidisphaeraceae bacterium]|nr:universal stress protein [Tepidisphaeraceae bacterium]